MGGVAQLLIPQEMVLQPPLHLQKGLPLYLVRVVSVKNCLTFSTGIGQPCGLHISTDCLQFLQEVGPCVFNTHAVCFQLLKVPVCQIGGFGGTGGAGFISRFLQSCLSVAVKTFPYAFVNHHIVAWQPCVDFVVMGEVLPHLAVIAGLGESVRTFVYE